MLNVHVAVRTAELFNEPLVQAAFVESVPALRHNLDFITFSEVDQADRAALILEAERA